MNKNRIEIKKFFKNLWLKVEPFINELIAYSFVILGFELVRRSIDIYLDATTKNAVNQIKQILLIGTLSLFVFHALVSLFFRVIAALFDEGKRNYDEITRESKNGTNVLNPKPSNFRKVVNSEIHKQKISDKKKNKKE